MELIDLLRPHPSLTSFQTFLVLALLSLSELEPESFLFDCLRRHV